MTNDEKLKKITEFHRNEQVKYVYYKIGICVASIAFIVNKTIDQNISLLHIPLFISVLLFLLTILIGFTYMNNLFNLLYLNIEHLDPTIDGIKIADKDLKKYHFDLSSKELIKKSDKGAKYMTWIDRIMYSAIVSFITWYILQMIY